MPYNGSGTFTTDVDFTNEAAAPPIEISKLDNVCTDFAAGLTNALTKDGQTNPTANIKLNGHRLINLGAATALTDAPRVTEIIDQDHIYYVDSGSANTYVITPSPAIAAYEEGQRFVVRIANASTGASTLNVNGLGAIAIQTADGTAVASGTLAAGGIYEFTYDANASPDRWVITSPTSKVPDGMLSSNVPLINASNTFTGATQSVKRTGDNAILRANFNDSVLVDVIASSSSAAFIGTTSNHTVDLTTNNTARLQIGAGGDYNFRAGLVTTSNSNSAEVGFKGTPQNVQNGDYTLQITDAGCSIDKQSGGAGETITIPANSSVSFPLGTVICGDNDGGGTLTIAITSDTLEDAFGNTGSRTVADNGQWVIKKIAATKWRITGVGIS